MIVTATMKCKKCSTTWEEQGYDIMFDGHIVDLFDESKAVVFMTYFCPNCQEWISEDRL